MQLVRRCCGKLEVAPSRVVSSLLGADMNPFVYELPVMLMQWVVSFADAALVMLGTWFRLASLKIELTVMSRYEATMLLVLVR
jgi:hypothetical protein